METRNALGNLVNRYRAVLKKCKLLNVFGTLAIAGALVLGSAGLSLAGEIIAGASAPILEGDSSDPNLTNNGSITGLDRTINGVSAKVGIFSDTTASSINFNLSNNGTIKFNDSTKDAIGMRAGNRTASTPAGTNRLINNASGVIEISGMSVSGMEAFQQLPSSNYVQNDGMITVSGTNAVAGISANSGSDVAGASNTIINNGTINASTSGNTWRAVGISLTYGGRVENTGIINVSAPNGDTFEVSSIGGPIIVGANWATTLRTWTPENTVFEATNTTVRFDNTNLIIRPGTAEQGFVAGQYYEVAHMTADHAKFFTEVYGTIAQVTTDSPFYTAEAVGLGGKTPKVRLVAEGSVITESAETVASRAVGNVHTMINNVAGNVQKSTIIQPALGGIDSASLENSEQGLSAGSHMGSEKKWAIFMTPYGSYTNNNEYDYTASAMGVTAGASYMFSPKFTLGFHLDFNYSNINGDNGLDNDGTSFAYGLHGNYFVNDNWYFAGQITGSHTSNDADYDPTSALHASDEYSSSAFYTALSSGCVLNLNKTNLLIPEIGLSYLSVHTGGYSFAFPTSAGNNLDIDSSNYDALYLNAKLTWQGNYQLASAVLSPSLGIGLRQNLTGSDIETNVAIGSGASFESTASEDDTTFTTTAGLEWRNDSFTLGAYYDGAYGSQQQYHSGSLKFVYKF